MNFGAFVDEPRAAGRGPVGPLPPCAGAKDAGSQKRKKKKTLVLEQGHRVCLSAAA